MKKVVFYDTIPDVEKGGFIMIEFFSMFFNSAVFMGLLALVFAVFCIRCLIYGTLAGTSTLLRFVLTIVFAALAYICWRNAVASHGSNLIDRFVFDCWAELKHMFRFVVNKIF